MNRVYAKACPTSLFTENSKTIFCRFNLVVAKTARDKLLVDIL